MVLNAARPGIREVERGGQIGGRLTRVAGRQRVVVLYKTLPQYRLAFFNQLRNRLEREDVDLVLIHGLPSGDDVRKLDSSTLPWARQVPNRIIRLPGIPDLYWQSCLTSIRSTDLVIVEQASKLLINYALLARQQFSDLRVAYWGHGRNFQSHSSHLAGEFIKRKASVLAHWWFAYNNTSADAVAALGYPDHRITVVNNAVDTAPLVRATETTSTGARTELRARLGLRTDNVAIYCGALYPEKRLPFLVEAAHRIRYRVPDFELLILGAGSDEATVRGAAAGATWIHHVGPKFGAERVPYFLASKVLLLPGLVGLAITDAFALQVPLVTIDVPYHSPEIEYLRNGENGVLLPADASPDSYASVVASLLTDELQLGVLRTGCRAAASTYTLESMVERFAQGVLLALAA